MRVAHHRCHCHTVYSASLCLAVLKRCSRMCWQTPAALLGARPQLQRQPALCARHVGPWPPAHPMSKTASLLIQTCTRPGALLSAITKTCCMPMSYAMLCKARPPSPTSGVFIGRFRSIPWLRCGQLAAPYICLTPHHTFVLVLHCTTYGSWYQRQPQVAVSSQLACIVNSIHTTHHHSTRIWVTMDQLSTAPLTRS
jgi:hypothetical protein